MRKFIINILLCVLGLVLLFSAKEAKANLQDVMSQKQLVGQARFEKFFMDIYDVRLYARDGSWREGEPLVLELQYLRNIKGVRIAQVSANEIRGLGFDDENKIRQWESAMRDIFPDVDDGTVLTGVFSHDGQSIFYHNDKELGRIEDPEFGRYFFGIWLDEKTSDPDLRAQILGLE